MNTKKHLPLNNVEVDHVTQIFRAYKHPYRYDIIGRLLDYGSLSAEELASLLQLEESYISEQLNVLLDSDLVFEIQTGTSVVFRANESKLAQVKRCVDSFLK